MHGSRGARRMDISPDWRQKLRKWFPDLEEGVTFDFTSPVDYNYNCLSWALGSSSLLLEDIKGAFWPWRNIPDDTPEGWARVCQIHGFDICESTDFVKGYEKIAILQNEDGELHATRQDRNGKWKSKLGIMGPDIDHVGLKGLQQTYGAVVFVLEKRRADWDEPDTPSTEQ